MLEALLDRRGGTREGKQVGKAVGSTQGHKGVGLVGRREKSSRDVAIANMVGVDARRAGTHAEGAAEGLEHLFRDFRLRVVCAQMWSVGL